MNKKKPLTHFIQFLIGLLSIFAAMLTGAIVYKNATNENIKHIRQDMHDLYNEYSRVLEENKLYQDIINPSNADIHGEIITGEVLDFKLRSVNKTIVADIKYKENTTKNIYNYQLIIDDTQLKYGITVSLDNDRIRINKIPNGHSTAVLFSLTKDTYNKFIDEYDKIKED